MPYSSPSGLSPTIGIEDIIYSTQEIYKHTEKIRRAYEHLKQRYEILSMENSELKSGSTKTPVDPINYNHKRRKTDESAINDSVASNDVLNEAIQEISSCVEDEIIESTPKPDISRKNVTKKIISSTSPSNRNQIKVEKFDNSKNDASPDEQKTVKKPESPLRSLENQSTAGKENRPTKWISNKFMSPSRANRSGPKGWLRMSLSKTSKHTVTESSAKPKNDTATDTCAETYLDSTPSKQLGDVKGKFLRQQCLEACFNSPKGSDDENMFCFQSKEKPNATSTTSPPNIKLEPQTGQVKPTNVSNVTTGNSQSQSGSSSGSGYSGYSSVIALSGVKDEVIVIEESQPLFEDCAETFCDKLELKMQVVESLAGGLKISGNENVIIDNHLVTCRQCKIFMESNQALTIKDKLAMIETCIARYPVRQDTDSEYWNPRFLPTPESQKQETLIDDRWANRKRKS